MRVRLMIWIGIEFGGMWETIGCVGLKDLAVECGFSYNGSRRKSKDGFMMKGLDGRTWMVRRLEVKRIVGRGKGGRGENLKKN